MSPGDSQADQRLSAARIALRQAEAQLLEASNLLEAAPGVTWGQLSPAAQRERRLIIFGAHLAWAKIDHVWKRLVAGGGPDSSPVDDHRGGQGHDVDEHQAATEQEANDPSGDAAGLPAG